MNAFAKGILCGVVLALVLFYGASRRPGGKARQGTPEPDGNTPSREEYLSVKGENTLLKKMLGQLEERIVILGPAGKKSGITGKLVWDKTMQQGFIHAGGLEPGMAYRLVLKTKQGANVVVAEQAGQTGWQTQFSAPERILDLVSVEILGKPSGEEAEMLVYARGVVPEN